MAKDRCTSTFRVDRETIRVVDKIAEETERSRSAVIRIALKEYVERETNGRVVRP